MCASNPVCYPSHAQSHFRGVDFSFRCSVKLVIYILFFFEDFFFILFCCLFFLSLSVLTGFKKKKQTNKSLIVYNCVPLKQLKKLEKSKAFTATFLVCITDVAQMTCMFYI